MVANLFLKESLSKFKNISLTDIIIEHILMVMMNDGRHGLAYGFLLNKVFDLFKVPFGKKFTRSSKQTFTMTMLEECECVKCK